jgi:hypothetical protein
VIAGCRVMLVPGGGRDQQRLDVGGGLVGVQLMPRGYSAFVAAGVLWQVLTGGRYRASPPTGDAVAISVLAFAYCLRLP